MTCIAGLIHNGKVFIGGDSAGVTENIVEIRKDHKVFKNGPFLMGFTSSFRMGQILRYNFTPPEHPEGMDDFKFMVSIFVERLKECFAQHGFGTKGNGQDTGGNFLVGYRSHLYCIESDYQVGENTYPYNAVGCGGREAIASLFSTNELIIDPYCRLYTALLAAATFNTGVKAPFNIISDDFPL